ncbi:ABC transporter ATP-binding protein [Roseimaritima ulvae]|uniref:Lipoprotein-releasing system ATP-binding protein LolD n=1 Tax=Roseimaritima ulvae TaxID=980254 RepID=A0A5B9QP64_9BACT|nr:ABC transporter ATP-binding protein [Roseimaritima ulvae]QEG39739.1 Lipoprotein-releasing system ATP-binding protein LolD [Roseimaritima ulvae]
MLVATGISKSYPTPGEPLQVLRDVSLRLAAGDSLAIVGPSGAGKSTLLQILGTLDEPTEGTVQLNDVDPFQLEETELARFRNRQIGFIFQDHHLLPQLTVLENVLIPALANGRPSAESKERAADLLQRVGLASRATHLPGELSGGERERVAVARALLNRPSLILADEPTGNLDRRTADAITELLLRLQQDENAILVTVTHSPTLAAAMAKQQTLIDGQLQA